MGEEPRDGEVGEGGREEEGGEEPRDRGVGEEPRDGEVGEGGREEEELLYRFRLLRFGRVLLLV